MTIDRVISRLADITDSYIGEPARYFHGVARNVVREARRRREVATGVPHAVSAEAPDGSDEYECLLRCLKRLPAEKRELILDFHAYKGRDKVERHREMAEELGITVGALRLRAHHLRKSLEKCVLRCVGHNSEKQKPSREPLLRGRWRVPD